MYGDARYGSRCNNIAGEIVQMRMKWWVEIFGGLGFTTESYAEMVYCAKERKEVNKRERFCKESMFQPTWHHFQIVQQYSHLVRSSRGAGPGAKVSDQKLTPPEQHSSKADLETLN